MKKMETDGLLKIGEGASAVIYQLNEKSVLKAYKSNFPREFVEKEYRCAKKAAEYGVPIGNAIDMIETGTGYGGIFEKLDGKVLLECMRDDHARIRDLVRQFGLFVKHTHHIILSDDIECGKHEMLSDLENREILGITESEQHKMIEILSAIPESNHFSHGDCHAGNVMLCSDGEFRFFDIGRMSRASEIIDYVSMFCQYRLPNYFGIQGSKSPNAKGFSDEEMDMIWDVFLRTVSGVEDKVILKEIEEQICVVSSIRMLLTKHYNKHFFSDKAYAMFIEKAVDYYEKGIRSFEWCE